MPVRTPLRPSGRRLRKSHLIAFNAQLMALALVLVMALAAASVLSLDVVGPEGQGSGDAIGSDPQTVPAITEGDAYVATSPVKPKVREVAVHSAPASSPAPSTSTPRAPQKAPAGRAVPTEAGLKLATTTATEHVSGLGTVGVTWAESDVYAEDAIRADVRSRKGTTWSAWQKIEYHDDHGPDAAEASGERSLRAGTEPTVVGHVDGVQVRVFTRTGRVPTAMRVVLIDPGADREVKRAPAIDTAGLAGTKAAERKQDEESSETGISLSAMKTAPKPQIYSRAQWGADERIREQSPPSYGTIETGFVHHTVNANNYTEAQVPALLRGIYAYHVLSRGWRDIGYNFLVDRFGRIWEGRYGGVDRAVIGAHTLGYNEVSFAMSAIGNFDIAQPPQAVVDAYARLFAWKLSMYNIPADASGINVKGKILHAINGHRDVGQTACPGKYLYARIPDIRAEAAKIQRGSAVTPPPSQPPTSVPALGIPVAADRVPLRSSVIGDRWPDLLVRNAPNHEVYTVPTSGQFAVGDAVTTDGSWSSYDQVVPVGDTNGDGKGDVLTRLASDGSAGMRYGNGDGTFASRSTNTEQFAGYSSLTGVGDMDGDGLPDVVGVKDGRIMLFHGAPQGAFVDPVLLGSTSPGGRLVGVGDVSAGPAPDLAYVSTSRHVVVLPTVRTAAGSAMTATLGAPQVLTTTVPVGMVLLGAADANGDGRPDLVVRDGDAVRMMPAMASGGFGSLQTGTDALQGVTHVSVGPAFGSAPGVVGIGTAGNLRALPMTSRIRMGTPIASGRELSDAVQLLSPGDWNGDGKADLITVTSTHAVGLRYGDGEGHYGAWNTMIDSVGSGTAMIAAGDVNGDGHPDLIARGGKGGLALYRGDGKHGFLSPPMRLPAGVRTYNQLGSGLWSATSSSARLVSSDGGFVPTAAAVPSYKLSRYDWVIGHGDVDGDGLADLMLRDKSNKGLYLLPGAVGGGFGALRYLGPGLGDYNIGG